MAQRLARTAAAASEFTDPEHHGRTVASPLTGESSRTNSGLFAGFSGRTGRAHQPSPLDGQLFGIGPLLAACSAGQRRPVSSASPNDGYSAAPPTFIDSLSESGAMTCAFFCLLGVRDGLS